MTITLDLQPEIEQGLLAQAQARGVSLNQFVHEIVVREAHLSEAAPKTRAQDLVELLAPVRGLFEDGELDFSRNPSGTRPVDLA